jgi:hypothetical protein
MPARLVHTARRIKLRAPTNWPWREPFNNALPGARPPAHRRNPRPHLTSSAPRLLARHRPHRQPPRTSSGTLGMPAPGHNPPARPANQASKPSTPPARPANQASKPSTPAGPLQPQLRLPVTQPSGGLTRNPPRLIEVKAYGRSARGQDLWLEPQQVEEADRNGVLSNFVVENVRQG